jgi:hypothetical protein
MIPTDVVSGHPSPFERIATHFLRHDWHHEPNADLFDDSSHFAVFGVKTTIKGRPIEQVTPGVK